MVLSFGLLLQRRAKYTGFFLVGPSVNGYAAGSFERIFGRTDRLPSPRNRGVCDVFRQVFIVFSGDLIPVPICHAVLNQGTPKSQPGI